MAKHKVTKPKDQAKKQNTAVKLQQKRNAGGTLTPGEETLIREAATRARRRASQRRRLKQGFSERA